MCLQKKVGAKGMQGGGGRVGWQVKCGVCVAGSMCVVIKGKG